jgi:hypothetical protein
VDEIVRLKGLIGTLAIEVARGQATKLTVDQGEKLVQGRLIAPAPPAEEGGDVVRRSATQVGAVIRRVAHEVLIIGPIARGDVAFGDAFARSPRAVPSNITATRAPARTTVRLIELSSGRCPT